MDQEAKEIAAAVTKELIQDSLKALYAPLSGFLTVQRAQFLEGFSKYSEYMFQRCSKVRTLYSKTEPVQLDDVYVESTFIKANQRGLDYRFPEAEIIKRFTKGERQIIKGNGGSGKTFFLKHLWLQRFKSPNGRIPVLLELRRLNDVSSLDIETFCRSELQAEIVLKNGVFEALAMRGKFEFIFDGFDEVVKERRPKIERQILDLSERYPECNFLVSGREDDRFASWGDFVTYSVGPLPLEDVQRLINSVPFESKVKKKFLGILNEDFYKDYQSFLSNPLLATMMLMTFNENAVIPSKLTAFYSSAFQTLLTWHDATKDSFERERALSIDEFRLVFSTFCLITYYETQFEFDEKALRDGILKALQYHSRDHSVDDVLNDFCETVNLLQRDGLQYVFVHRSFQEFFAAECAMNVVSGKEDTFLETFANRIHDNTFLMCYEIHPEQVYDKYLAAKIELYYQFLSGILERPVSDSKWVYSVFEEASFKLRLMKSAIPVSSIRIMTAENFREVSSFLELVQPLTDYRGDLGAWSLFQYLNSAINEARKEAHLSRTEEEEFSLSVKFGPNKLSLSIRNGKYSTLDKGEISRFRNALSKCISLELKKFRKDTEEALKEFSRTFANLQAAREQKEASIDVILGLAN